MLPYLLDLAIAAIPGCVWLWIFYRKDRFEPEPKQLIFLAFFLGGALVPLQVFLSSAIDPSNLNIWLTTFYAQDVAVALSEEALKGIVLYLVFYRHKEFNEPMDGIVYGASIGIGFATFENALFMIHHGREVLLSRMLLSTTLHVACSSLFGYALGRLKFVRRSNRLLPIEGYMAAVGVHALFDAVSSFGRAADNPCIDLVCLAALLILVFALLHTLEIKVDDALRRSPFRPIQLGRKKKPGRNPDGQ